jgi:hypothetical protein
VVPFLGLLAFFLLSTTPCAAAPGGERPHCIPDDLAHLRSEVVHSDLVHPPAGETQLSEIVTSHGRFERTAASRHHGKVESWLKAHTELAHELGIYSAGPGQLWLPDPGEFNFRVQRYLASKGYAPRVQHFTLPGYASSEEYVAIVSKNGFPLAEDLGMRQHDLEHGVAIALISSTPHGRKVLEAGYRRVEAFKALHQKLLKLWPDLEKELDPLFYGPPPSDPFDSGTILSTFTEYIERGSFGISEILFGHQALVSKGTNLSERVRRVYDILGNAADTTTFDVATSKASHVPWSARLSDNAFVKSPLGRKLTPDQLNVVHGLLDEIDRDLKPVDAATLDAATQEMVQLLSDQGYQ